MIKEWLAEFAPANKNEAHYALREIMQEIALAGLYRAGFFENAAFYGGTALRIFHKLDRFSEDLDFSLLRPDPQFSLEKYFDAMKGEFESLGIQVSIRDKKKTKANNVESAFVKSETVWKELVLDGMLPQNDLNQFVGIKIKIEVDKNPPMGFQTDENLLLKPFSFYVKCFSLPDLFAGKMHALLFRKWQNNVKGRDWYDFEWYVTNKIPINLSHFIVRAKESGDLLAGKFDESDLKQLLLEKINTVNMDRVKSDVIRFIPNSGRLAIWSPAYFKDLVKYLLFL